MSGTLPLERLGEHAPTCSATSRPTTSASSIGPMGMPKRVPASSITAAGMPSREREKRLVDVRHQNAVDHEARSALAGQRQLVELAREARASCAHLRRCVRCALHDLDQLHLRDRIEEMDAHQPPGSRELLARGSSILMLEVLVANTAPGLSLGSSSAYSARLASTFSTMASITTSAVATPSPDDVRAQPGRGPRPPLPDPSGACRTTPWRGRAPAR